MANDDTVEACHVRAARYRTIAGLVNDGKLVCWLLSQADEYERRAVDLKRGGQQANPATGG